MKKTLIGIALLITSAIAYVGISISAAIYSSHLTEWQSNIGKIGTALSDNVLLSIPLIIVTIMFILGVIILKREYFSKIEK